MIKTKKVFDFIRGLSGAERIFTGHLLDFSSQVQATIDRWGISKKEFCKEMEIKERVYNDFIKGSYNYSLHDIARLSALRYKKIMAEKEIEAQKESESAGFPDYKYSQIQPEYAQAAAEEKLKKKNGKG